MEDRKLTAEEIDTIGEIMNISMGAAATAVSTMLERQVVITTPKIEQNSMRDIDCSELEPAIVVKINYVEGLSGTNVIVLRRSDMRIILDLLMGNDLGESDGSFEFDEMSMSAACEVMNQMMGASSTALSELLNETINISTPQALLVESESEFHEMLKEYNSDDSEEVTAISFKMTIKETLDTSFSSFMPVELAKSIVHSLHSEIEEKPEKTPEPEIPEKPEPKAFVPESVAPPESIPVYQPEQVKPPQQKQPSPVPEPINPTQQPKPEPRPAPRPEQINNPQPSPQPYPPQQPNMYVPPVPPQYQQPVQDQYSYGMQQMPQQAAAMQYRQPYPQQYMQQQYGNEYYQQPYSPYQDPQSSMRYVTPAVKQADFPEFSSMSRPAGVNNSSNINLLMGVQLEVSVIVGRSKQKIRDVLEFGQGSVIELDKQTGAPAEIMVNGQLLAYGDVVVVGDNFGVRVTEIVGTKELLESLDAKK